MPSTSSAATYGTPQAYPTGGTFPYGTVTGDFNGDGNLDVVTADLTSNTISVFLGNGDGTFQAAVTHSTGTGTGPWGIAAADLNGDGKLDLVVTDDQTNQVSVMLGNGDGTFQAPVAYSVGFNPRSVSIVDTNHDGRLDLIVADAGSGDPASTAGVSILLGNGDGTFGTASNLHGYNAQTVTVGDFNGDGNIDFALTGFTSSNIAVYLGKGDGTFNAPVNYAIGSGTNPDGIAAADLNGDGKLDLAVTDDGSNKVYVLIGVGDGTFGAAVPYTSGFNSVNVIAVDFNGDGKVDLLTPNPGSANTTLLLGNGDGTFKSPITYFPGGETAASGDFNHDGKLDVAIANSGGNLEVFANTTPGPIDHFVISSPSTETAGVPFSITITAEDAANRVENDWNGFSGTVDLSTSAGGITPAISGNFTAGVLTASITISGYGSSVTIAAADPASGKTGYILITVLQGAVVVSSHHGGELPPWLIEQSPISGASYTFNTNESGHLAYAGGCTSPTQYIQRGDITINFSTLSPQCSIQLFDLAGNKSNILTVANSDAAPAPAADFTFEKALDLGMHDPDVVQLQKYLNAHGAPVAASGPGSPGNETDYFGPATKQALIAFQNAHAADILAPAGLTQGTGAFHALTRAYVNLHP